MNNLQGTRPQIITFCDTVIFCFEKGIINFGNNTYLKLMSIQKSNQKSETQMSFSPFS